MSEKKDYEVAVDEFEEADKAFNELKERVVGGRILQEIYNPDVGAMMAQWQAVMSDLQKLLEERNKLLVEAQNALRQAVPITDTQWRGAEGAPTVVSYGRFKATSKTYRSFDAQSLIEGVTAAGKLNEMMQLKVFDKRSGGAKPAIQQKVEVDYEQVKTFLRLEKLDTVFNGSYDEEEGTPAVTGPKPIAFIGENKDK